MLGLPAAGDLQDVEMPRDVRRGIGAGVLDRIAHASLGAEMNDAIKRHIGQGLVQGALVGEVDPDELEPVPAMRGELRQPRLFQRDAVIIVEIVDTDDGVAAREQAPGHVIADEAGRAGHENTHQVVCSPRRGLESGVLIGKHWSLDGSL